MEDLCSLNDFVVSCYRPADITSVIHTSIFIYQSIIKVNIYIYIMLMKRRNRNKLSGIW